MMRGGNIERGFVATATVLHPVANTGNCAATQLSLFDDLSIFLAVFEHSSSVQAGADLDNFFFGHHIPQEILHSLSIGNSGNNLGELPGCRSLPN